MASKSADLVSGTSSTGLFIFDPIWGGGGGGGAEFINGGGGGINESSRNNFKIMCITQAMLFVGSI